MHNSTAASARSSDYRERLSPSLWALLSTAVVGPMIALVFVPLDATIALFLGIGVAATMITALVFTSPVVRVRGGELRVGRAHIDTRFLRNPEVLTGAEAREARGPGLHRDAWHLLRPGIDGVVRVAVDDERDPASQWVFSSRTPERVAAAISRAQRD